MPYDCPCVSLHADLDVPLAGIHRAGIHRIGDPIDGSLARLQDAPGAPE